MLKSNREITVSKNSKIDCTVRVITPENIEFEYMLAGPFQRLPAFGLDLLIRWAFIVIVFVGAQFAGLLLWITGTEWLLTVVIILLYFFISWFYGIVLETFFSGRTFGKMVFKLRAISVDGRPINASQAAVRNLLRSADMAPLLSLQVFAAEAPAAYIIPTLFLGLISMVVTTRMQRIGDLAARTMVIVDRGNRSPNVQQPDDTRAYTLAQIIPPTFQVSRTLSSAIGMYMETRKRFVPARRSEVAMTLARPLIRQMGLSSETSPDLMLCAMYVNIFLSEEHRNLVSEQRERANRQTIPMVAPGMAIRSPDLPPVGSGRSASERTTQLPTETVHSSSNVPPQATSANSPSPTAPASQLSSSDIVEPR